MWTSVLHAFGWMRRRVIAGSYGKSVLSFVTNHLTVLQGGRTVCIPTSRERQSLWLRVLPAFGGSVFCILSTLAGRQWCLLIVSVGVSLMT